MLTHAQPCDGQGISPAGRLAIEGSFLYLSIVIPNGALKNRSIMDDRQFHSQRAAPPVHVLFFALSLDILIQLLFGVEVTTVFNPRVSEAKLFDTLTVVLSLARICRFGRTAGLTVLAWFYSRHCLGYGGGGC